MATLGNVATAIAFNRFGLGGRPDDAIPSNPQAWLISQLAGPDPYTGAGMLNTAACLAYTAGVEKAAPGSPAQIAWLTQISQLFAQEQAALMTNAVTTRAPFRERLVWFWTNHFSVTATSNSGAETTCGAYMRETIRPHVNGTFKDMLLAVYQHPTMLYSLTNYCSAGPQSAAARQCAITGCKSLGINENLGRECLELHTVSVNAGYSQADVDALAMLLTGWTVTLSIAPLGFTYNTTMHQPGPQTLMGQIFGTDQNAGIAALTYLATHPATYQHLATKLVTHFVSDTPAPGDIAIVAQALAVTGGNLAAAAAAVVNLPSAWQPATKLRTPMDYVTAVLRSVGDNGSGILTAPATIASILGEPLWMAPFPNGYSDLAADWAGTAQMLLRADWINALCTLLTNVDPAAVAGIGLGPLLQPSTAAAIAAATILHDKLSLLFLSAEFQRR